MSFFKYLDVIQSSDSKNRHYKRENIKLSFDIRAGIDADKFIDKLSKEIDDAKRKLLEDLKCMSDSIYSEIYEIAVSDLNKVSLNIIVHGYRLETDEEYYSRMEEAEEKFKKINDELIREKLEKVNQLQEELRVLGYVGVS